MPPLAGTAFLWLKRKKNDRLMQAGGESIRSFYDLHYCGKGTDENILNNQEISFDIILTKNGPETQESEYQTGSREPALTRRK